MSNDFKTGFKKLSKGRQIFLGLSGGIVMVFFVLLFFGTVVQFLWNATIASIFDLSPISYWQAIGLLILAKLFFGFGGSSASNKGKTSRKRRDGPPSGDEGFKAYWKNEGKDAWEAFQAGKSEADALPEA